MEKPKSIKQNMFMSVILTTANFLFPLITYSYVARILKADGTGKVAFVQSVLAYFTYFAALGIPGYGVRECAKERDNQEKLSKIVHELFIINIITTVLSYVALVIVIVCIKRFQTYSALFMVMSFGIILQTLGMEWLYKSLEKYTYITIRSIFFKSISVILTFLLIKTEDDYIKYGALTIFAAGASNIMNFIHVKKFINLKKQQHYDFKVHLKPIMVFFMSTIIITVYAQFDTVMLGLMKGDREVGIYNAAVKMKTIVLSVSTAITSVLIPRMSQYVKRGDNEQFRVLLMKSLRVCCVTLFPLTFFVIFNTKDIITFVCGTEYLSSTLTLIILMLCVLALMLTNILGNQILIPKNDEKRYSISVFIGMWINLSLNMLLIPKYASAGAAVATLVTEVFNVYWMGRGCREEIIYMIKNICLKKYVLSLFGAVSVHIVIGLILCELSLIIRLFINVFTMFGVYYLFLYIVEEPVIREGVLVIRKLVQDRCRMKH